MWSRKAVCLRCGAWKSEAWTRCRRCKLDPRIDESTFTKSVFLSPDRFDDAARRKSYRAELAELATAIARGRPVVFAPEELVRIEQRLMDPRQVTRAAFGAVFRSFLPGLLFLAGLWALIFLLRGLGRPDATPGGPRHAKPQPALHRR